MSRRQRPSNNRAAAIGLGLVLAALLLWLSFLPGATGIPLILARWQRRLVGLAAPVLPFYVLLSGLVLIAAGRRVRFSRRILGLLLASVAALLILHLRTVSGDLWRAGLDGRGGGLIAGALAWCVARVLGIPGLWVMAGAIGAAALLMVSGISLTDVGEVLRAAAYGLGLLAVWVAQSCGRLGLRALRWSVRLASHLRPVVGLWLARAVTALGAIGRTIAAETGRQLARIRAAAAPPHSAPHPVPALEGPALDVAAESPSMPEAPEAPELPPMLREGPPPEGQEPVATARRRRRAAVEGQQESLEFAAVTFHLPSLTM
ncbi:MAG: hypothetical protein ACRDGN_09210, partial [bacterium]